MPHRSTRLRALGAFVSVVVTGAGLAMGAAAPAIAAPAFTSRCFTTTPNVHELGVYTVPAGVSQVRAVLHGQDGAHGENIYDTRTAGGLGSSMVVEFGVTLGEVLHVGTIAGGPAGNAVGGWSGGKGGDAQYVTTLGADGCQHALAVAAGGGGGSGQQAHGGNADAGKGATGGESGGSNTAADGGGGGAPYRNGVEEGGWPGAAGSSNLGCTDGNHGSWGSFLQGGQGGDAPAPKSSPDACVYYSHSGGGGGAGYWFGGGGGSAYGSISDWGTLTRYSPGAGGGGLSWIDSSVTKISESQVGSSATPIAAPIYDTATALQTTPNPSYAGQAVTVSTHTTVVGSGDPVRLGNVSIYNGSTLLATVPVAADGTASWTTQDLRAGDQNLTATFASVEDPSVAYRASSSTGTTQTVHPCAPVATFFDRPQGVTATTGTDAQLAVTVSVSSAYEGIPAMRWQTSADNGATWTDAQGTAAFSTIGVTAGYGRATLTSPITGGPRTVSYRAIATTCGGSATSDPGALTIRAVDFNLTALPAKTFGAGPFDVAGYASKSNVPVAFSSLTAPTCSVQGSTVTVLAAGTCTLAADESGSNGYSPAPQVQQSFTTAKKPIAVTAVATPLSQPQGTTTAPSVACNPTGFLGTDTYTTPPVGVIGHDVLLRDGTSVWRPISLFSILQQGTYLSRCSGGDPGSNYVISWYTDGHFTITAPVKDTAPPVVTVPADLTVEATSPDGAIATYDAATATDGVDGATSVTCTPTSGSTFSLGTTTVSCSSTDHAGNKGTSTFTVTVADTTAPKTTITSAPIGPTKQTAATVTFAGSDAVGVTGYECQLDDGAYAACTSPQSYSGLTEGSHTVHVRAIDAAGNTDPTPAATSWQIDTTAPVVSHPSDQILEATGATGATATFGATAQDGVDGSLATTCDPASGSTFALGATTVTCSATDTAGNTGTGTFKVSVRDTTAPDTELTGGQEAGRTRQTSAQFTFSGTDLVGVTGYECKLDDGAFAACTSTQSYTGLADGSHTFWVRARDAAGNVDQSPATVTWVVDTTPPVVSVPADRTVSAIGPDGVAVTYTSSATDADPAAPIVTCTPASGSTFAIGTTTVTCSATDTVGNTGRSTFMVTVQGARAQLSDLLTTVQNLPPALEPGTRKNLTAIVQNALASVIKQDTAGACDKLTSFISQVNAQSGKKITAATAGSLVADARRIMKVLGC